MTQEHMNEEQITAWVTKHALTLGISEVQATVCHSKDSGMIKYKPGGEYYSKYVHGNDWHRTKESAIARAETMRAKKIASLRKQIEKLESISFGDEEIK